MKFTKLVKASKYKFGDSVLLDTNEEAVVKGNAYGSGGVQTRDYYTVVVNPNTDKERETEVHESEIIKKIASKRVKADWNTVTVGELKGILEDCLYILGDFEDDHKCKVHPNTYGLHTNLLSIPSKGFIVLDEPVGDDYDEDEE